MRVTRIRATRGWGLPNLREAWVGRELLGYLVLRNIRIRYSQTIVGAGWTVIQPLLPMVIFTIFFGRLAGVPSDGVPYHVFSLSGLVIWTYISTTLSNGAQSLVSDAPLITKVYVPRILIPIAWVCSGALDLAITLVLLVVVLAISGPAISLTVLLSVPFVVLALLVTTGLVLWLSALNVRYRDVRVMVPFLVQTLLFVTPIAYPASLVEGRWRYVYGLNPVVGPVEGFRWAVLNSDTNPWPMILPSMAVALVLLLTGALYFRRVDRTFADVV